MTRNELIDKAWRSGNLTYKLKPCQQIMKKAINAWDGFKYVIKCSRRLGKTFLLCTMSDEVCLQKPGAMVRYGAGTTKALRKIIIPVMNMVLRDCPKDIRPVWKSSESVYQFKNGSEIHLAGVDLHPDHLRGTAADFALLDEAGSIAGLDYVIDDILMPQFLDPDGQIVKGRKMVLASSPAKSPAHEFTDIAHKAEAEGNYSHFTIYDGGYSDELIARFMKEAGGEHSTTWRREYLAEDVVDENYAVIPEWKEEYEMEPVKNEYWPYYLKYESLDLGVRDKTVCLFAHYDFKKATLFVHDEFTINGPQMTTERLAAGIKAKEPNVFGDHSVAKRISDIELLLIQDLSRLHGLPFSQTDKGRLEEMVNEVRMWVNAGRVRISPKCKQAIGCVRYGVWNDRRSEFERSKAYGHFDALAALVYLVRNIDVSCNPIPRNFGLNKEDLYDPKEGMKSKNAETMKKAFKVGGKFGFHRA